jgi:hypothetical protein
MPTQPKSSGIRDNHYCGSVGDFLKLHIQDKSRLSVVSAYFTIYAYEALKDWLDRMADDLQRSFPRMSGFSRTNIYRMRTFYIAWAGASGLPKNSTGETAAGEIVPQGVGRFETSIVPFS